MQVTAICDFCDLAILLRCEDPCQVIYGTSRGMHMAERGDWML
jgi:hypothetical protein